MTTSPDIAPDNPFSAAAVGVRYRRGRPYHHPRTLAHVLTMVGLTSVGADAPAPARALDVACGTGMSTTALAEVAGIVVGVDRSPEMMRVAPPMPNVSYVLGRAERLPFRSGAFDALTCSSGVHWFDQESFFAEVARVLRPGAWVGLYDHYFLGMPGVDEFGPWVEDLFARFPLPGRNPQVGDPRSRTPPGFEVVGAETFEDPIEMTREEFADYQITVSSCVAATERGTPVDEIRDWLLSSTEPLFAGSKRVVRFVGTVNCLRRLP